MHACVCIAGNPRHSLQGGGGGGGASCMLHCAGLHIIMVLLGVTFSTGTYRPEGNNPETYIYSIVSSQVLCSYTGQLCLHIPYYYSE